MKTIVSRFKGRAVATACGVFAVLLAACGGGAGSVSGAADAPPAGAAPVLAPSSTAEAEAPAPLHVTEEADLAFVSGGGADEGAATPMDVGEQDFRIIGYGLAPPLPPASGALLPPDLAQRLYVSPKGSDSSPGTALRPFRSLARAAVAARPGTRVLVAPGSYIGGVRTGASGAPRERITFLSTTKWGAVIVPPADSKGRIAWDNRGDYVDIIGFDIDGSVHRAGVRWTHGIYSGGSFDSIRNNRVHHVAQGVACTGRGGAAIGVDSYFKGSDAEVVANLVHDIGPAGCRFVQGIYVSTPAKVKNNVVYRVAEAGIHLWHDAHDVIITNNTVMASNTGIIVGGGDYYHTQGPNDRTQVLSNLVVDNKIGISEQGRTGRLNSYANNLVYANARYDWSLKNGLSHSGTVSQAPQLVDAGEADTPAVKPGAGSPAVGRGSPVNAESTDFEGRPRTAREGYDIGAVQH
jgi:hypothetical protein